MNENAFRKALDEWFADARQEAERLFNSGCHVPDVLNIATAIANSRMNRRTFEKQTGGNVVTVHGSLPKPS